MLNRAFRVSSSTLTKTIHKARRALLPMIKAGLEACF